MSNRRQLSFDVAQMGKVWVASISILGVSAVGATEEDAIQAMIQAISSHKTAESFSE